MTVLGPRAVSVVLVATLLVILSALVGVLSPETPGAEPAFSSSAAKALWALITLRCRGPPGGRRPCHRRRPHPISAFPLQVPCP